MPRALRRDRLQVYWTVTPPPHRSCHLQLIAHGDMGLAWQAAEAAVPLCDGATGAALVLAGAVEELAYLLQVGEGVNGCRVGFMGKRRLAGGEWSRMLRRVRGAG